MLKLKLFAFCLLITVSWVGSSNAITLEEAISIAVETNPQILESFENREAIEFELQQARGAFMPSIDLEAGSGIRRLDNESRRSLGTDNDQLNEAYVGLTLRQSLFDGGSRKAELARQAARVDSASYRALDRAELVALAVAREYLEFMLQAEVVDLAKRNLQQVNFITEGIDAKIESDVLTVADGRLARERRQSSLVRMKVAEQELAEASVRFERLVGRTLSSPQFPMSRSAQLPSTVSAAIAEAQMRNPRIGFADADIDAAATQVSAARADYLPQVDFEASARYGSDLDGAEGVSTDLAARLVARWNIFDGGRKVALVQENVRRAGEAQYGRDVALREIVELVQSAWNRRSKQDELAREYQTQADLNAGLVTDYKEQFDLNQRSLLDVLSTQNTRFNSEISARTAAYAALFAEYELFAAMGSLNYVLGTSLPEQTAEYARAEFGIAEQDISVGDYRRLPSRQVSGSPFNLLAPLSDE